MRHGDALEMIPDEGHVGKSLVGQCPVGQHLGKRGEDIQFACCAATSVGRQEGRNHNVRSIHVCWCDVALCRITGAAKVGHSHGVLASDVLSFHALLVYREHGAEPLEGRTIVSVGSVAAARERRTERHDGHVERTRLCGGRTLIHVLYAL